MKLSVRNIFQKVFLVFDFGHFFLSIFEKPKKVLKKGFVLSVSEHNDHNSKKITQKSVTIIFSLFCIFLNSQNYLVDMVDKKASLNFSCKDCDFKCSRSCDWNRHISTRKHKEKTISRQTTLSKSVLTLKKTQCLCGKEYSGRQGLWKHRKICSFIEENDESNFSKKISSEELFRSLLKDNQEFKQMIIEQNNKIIEFVSSKNTTIINNTTNNNNFNLQMFLNVQCKDALNISEFVESLQPKIEDLENTGRLGYVEGISKIFLNGLQGLDINKRPIHCSDQKRETIYIKDNNVWEKESDKRDKLKLAIKTVASKNIKQIPLWQKENPDCFDSSSKKNDQYLKIVSNSMNGLTSEESNKNFDKIITKLAKEVIIQKDQI